MLRLGVDHDLQHRVAAARCFLGAIVFCIFHKILAVALATNLNYVLVAAERSVLR